jgi:hypothetical protein
MNNSNRNKKPTGRSKELTDELNRTFNGLPIVEAEHELRLQLMPDDIDNADRKSFDNCVFARACKRQFAAQKIVLMKTTAYISMPDENGNLRVERFLIPPQAQQIIKNFDKGKKIKPNTAFYFKPPTSGRTLEAERKRKRKYQKRKAKMKNKATVKGEKNNVEKGYSSKPKVIELDVRNGTGLIQTKVSSI